VLGIGQYPITVMDHANGLATMAAGGLRATAHFVEKVMKRDTTVYGERLPRPDQPRIFSQQNSNDLTYALSQVGSAKVNIGWDTAGKTGTWEYTQATNENAHAWMVGFDKKIAAAVWVGNRDKEQSIKDKNNAVIWGSGIPSKIWQKFMTDATRAMNEKKVNTKFNPPSHVGTDQFPGAEPSPTPAAPPPDPNQGQGPGTGGGNGGGNGGGIQSSPPPTRGGRG
jgi:membrane peptidoglycan carboxypeptidase